MGYLKLIGTIIISALFFIACTSTQPEETTSNSTASNEPLQNELASGSEDFYASDNLDLNAVGMLLEKSSDAENFEFLLNTDKRTNNLDLNGDGYVDYISVAEYDDRDSNQRGFTLFNKFGADDIQEVANLIFDRDRNDNRGARILLRGNEQIYGNNYNYETNWLDKSLGIVDWVFRDRDTPYQSPYYYDNYPSNYSVYRALDTPVYITRIRESYPTPIFIRTTQPAIKTIKIKSKYNNRSMNKIFAKLAKPSKEQIEFRRKNPNRPVFVEIGNDRKDNDSSKSEKRSEKDRREYEKPSGKSDEKDRRSDDRGKGEKPEKQNDKSDKPGKSDKSKGDSKKGGGEKHSKDKKSKGNG